MKGSVEGYITLQQAADLLGVSRQTVTRRALSTGSSLDSSGQSMDTLGQLMDSNLDSPGLLMDSKPASIVRGKKRYISRAWVLAEQEAAAAGNGPAVRPGPSVDTLGQSMDSKLDSLDSNLDSPGQSLDSPGPSVDSNLDSSLDSPAPSMQTMQQRIRQLEKDLLAAQGEANALRATVAAQEAHIDSLKRALDGEQALHMASLQQRLPAGRGGLMDWIRGRGKKHNDR